MPKTSTEKARETVKKEVRSVPIEKIIDEVIDKQLKVNPGIVEKDKYFEIPDKIVMFYKYSYGSQSRFFKTLKEDAKLSGTKCSKCNFVYFPPRANCSECYSDVEWIDISNEAVVLSSTTVWYSNSEFFDRVPFAMAYIKPVNADTAILQRIELNDKEYAEPNSKVMARFRKERRGAISDFWYELL
ncbi:MAG: zinc ribbon domain-containing protein [Candidatus Thermoplasmatota archaeon]|jgi:uncharacterized OB-fold protein|nr:zinc ribbon domain-containing protein [Candidatus Thermoplasmatota archaeon]MCL5963128.1 zinc ribbon domain-containing protein [Candidatus Thermoplasmatota archaeon]